MPGVCLGFSRRAAALRTSIGVLAAAIVLVVGLGVALSGRLMFFSSHDLELLWVVLGFALALGLVLAITVPGSMTRDLEEMASAARRVGRGERGIRADVDRNNEMRSGGGGVRRNAGATREGRRAEGSRRADKAKSAGGNRS